MADKKIRFTTEENVSSTIQRLKRDSEELGRGLIRDARTYTTSGKETLSYIEGQIKAIERRSRAEKQSQLLIAESKKQRGTITEKQFKSQVSGIQLASKEDQQQVFLLRELIETVKNTSKKEIIEDRKGVDRRISKSTTVGTLAPRGNELAILKETLQRQQLGDVKEQEYEERARFSGDRVGRTTNAVAGLAMNKNQFYALASTLAFTPIVGQAASALAQKALSSAERYQTAAGGMSQLTGGGYGRYLGRGEGMEAIGMTKAETLELNKQVAIARGKERGSYKASIGVAFMGQATGVDQNMLLEQERLTRGGGLGAVEGTQRLVKGLQGVGAIKGQDTTLLNEYLPLLVNLQKEQLKITGQTNNEMATDIIAGLSSLGGSFLNPEVLKGIIPALMGRSTSPQGEALQFRALSMMPGNQGKSLLDLEIMMESPNIKMIEARLAMIKRVSPNRDIFTQNIAGEFGITKTLSREIAGGFGESGFDLGDYSGQLGITNVSGRATGAVGELDKASAAWTQKFEVVGNELVEVISELTGVMPDVKEAVVDAVTNITKIQQVQTEAVDAMRNSSNLLTRILSYMRMESGKFQR